MAIQESNVIMFQQSIDPERKEGVRIAEQFLEKIDGLIMKACAGNWRQPKRESWRAMRAPRGMLNFCSFRSDAGSVIVAQLGVK